MNTFSNITKSGITFLLMFLCCAMTSATEITVNFSGEGVDAAIKRASEEGKLVLIDFYASWCTPCKWMEKTTFKDPAIVQKLNTDFIPVKVNIDDSRGFEMKNKYEVNYLPTILILNSRGQMIERVEETLNAANLLDLLEMHDHSGNRVTIKHHFNTSPKNLNPDNDNSIDPWKITKEDYYRYVQMEERRNYKVQVGIYSNYDDARKKVNALKEIFYEPIVVLNDFHEGQVIFRVMLGQFNSISEAESFRVILDEKFEIDGIVF